MKNLNETKFLPCTEIPPFQAVQRRVLARFRSKETAGLFFSLLMLIWALYFARHPATVL